MKIFGIASLIFLNAFGLSKIPWDFDKKQISVPFKEFPCEPISSSNGIEQVKLLKPFVISTNVSLLRILEVLDLRKGEDNRVRKNYHISFFGFRLSSATVGVPLSFLREDYAMTSLMGVNHDILLENVGIVDGDFIVSWDFYFSRASRIFYCIETTGDPQGDISHIRILNGGSRRDLRKKFLVDLSERANFTMLLSL